MIANAVAVSEKKYGSKNTVLVNGQRYLAYFGYSSLEALHTALMNDETSLTPLALDGAIAPDNQQVSPADVLVGEGTLPEPPRQ